MIKIVKKIIALIALCQLLLSNNKGVLSSHPGETSSSFKPPIPFKETKTRKIRTKCDDSHSASRNHTKIISKLSANEDLTAIDSIPEDVMIKIFAMVTCDSLFLFIRRTLALVSKKWKAIAYSEILHPTALKLVYDHRLPPNKRSKKHDQAQAINFDAFKILEMNIIDDMRTHFELYHLAKQRVSEFKKVQKLRINMQWTSSNDFTLDILAEFLRKSKALKEFSLKWTELSPKQRITIAKDESNKNVEFWKELEKSKVTNIEFEMTGNYYENGRAKRAISENFANWLHFYSYIFETTAVTKNILKLKLKIPPSLRTYNYLKNSIKNNHRTIEEINVDFYYFVHWIKEKENLTDQLSNCENLRKLVLHFPIINSRWNKGGENLELMAWENIIDVIERRPNTFVDLTTNLGFLKIYDFTRLFRAGPANAWKSVKALEVRENFVKEDPLNHLMGIVLGNCPELEKLKIFFHTEDVLEDDADAVKFFFESASKLNNLKEFEIVYKRYGTWVSLNLLDSFASSKTINKITVTVTSAIFLQYYYEANYIAESANQFERMLALKRMEYVGKGLLDDMMKEVMEHRWNNAFTVESTFYTRFIKDDSHLLILTRK